MADRYIWTLIRAGLSVCYGNVWQCLVLILMLLVYIKMGFDGLFFARLDYGDKNTRLDKKTMEMVWRGSSSLKKDTQIFTGVLYHHYTPPDGFCFDQKCADPPIQVCVPYKHVY